MEEIMKNIDLKNLDKSTWQTYRFDQIAKKLSETVDPNTTELNIYIGLEHIDAENIHIKRKGSPSDVSGGKLKCYPGDVIFGKRRAYQRKAAIVDFEGICSAHAFVLRAIPDVMDPRLFPFFLHSDLFMDNAVDISVGGLSPTINWGQLKEQEFLLPPKDQQTQLADLLWALDEVIEKENEVLEKLLITNQSQCKSSVDFGYDSNKLKLPDGWRMMKTKDFSTVQAGSTPLRSNKEFFNEGIHPWVKTLDLNNDSILSTEEKITDLALAKTSCKLREAGTILVAMYGGFNQIGRTGLLEIEAATNQAISAVMVDQRVILPEFLLLVLNTKSDYWKKVAISSRKDPNITKVDVENFPVPVPSLAVQESILLNTNSILRSIENAKAKISSSKSLQKSLINQVF